MERFKAIFWFECSALLRQWSTYFYVMAFAGLAFISMIGTGGFFDGVPPQLPNSPTPQLLNSPYELSYIFLYFNKLMLFLVPAIIGMRLYQDTTTATHEVLYSFPIKKEEYLLAKFSAAFTIVMAITLIVLMATLVGEFVLGQENPKIGPNNGMAYAQVLFLFLLPNFLVFGVLVFTVVGWTRNIFAGFGVVLLLFLWQLIVENVFSDQASAVAILDPFGQNALQYATRSWTLELQNTQLVPLWGAVAGNRLFWLLLAGGLAWFFGSQFELQSNTPISGTIFRKRKKREPLSQALTPAQKRVVHYDFSLWQQIHTLRKLAWIDAQYIMRSWLFLALLGFGIAAVVFAIARVTNNGSVVLLPMTRLMLSVPLLFFTAIITLKTFIFGGLLVHRARLVKSQALIDTTPTADWVLLGSKIGALFLIQVVLLGIWMGCGIGLQVFNGYYELEVDVYLFHLLVLVLPALVIWAILTVTAHTLISNMYLVIFFLLLLWVGKDQLHHLGLDSFLWQFNTTPRVEYSDMNGFGSRLQGVYWVQLYWALFAVLLGISAYVFWSRGLTFGWRDHLAKAQQKMNSSLWAIVLLLCLGMMGLGYGIYQEEQASVFHESDAKKHFQAFQKRLGHLQNLPQPKIRNLSLQLDLFPEREAFQAKGQYTLVNTTSQVIDTILVKKAYDEQTSVAFAEMAYLIDADSNMRVEVYQLQDPLLPGDTSVLTFEIQHTPNTLFTQNSPVLHNGTFMKTDILPRIGFFYETNTLNHADSLVRQYSLYAKDADEIRSSITISTSGDQRAFAPGQLQKEWQEDGRNYYHYQTAGPIKFALAFLSGVYDTQTEQYKETRLSIHHHPMHKANNTQQLDGLKAAVDYNSEYFSPLKVSAIDVIEFPHTLGSFATFMETLIPSSALNFTLNSARAAEKIDLAFYVSAHELTHHWWGTQMVPARANGAKMLTESITEYITLQIFEDYYGPQKAKDFLNIQHQRYLRGRRGEAIEEKTLVSVNDEQEYIAYGKGTVAFNALKHLWGEAALNAFLQTFLKAYPSEQAIYPTTTDFINLLRAQLPKDLHYLIEDYFESISFQEARILSAKRVQNSLEVKLVAKKWCMEEKGAMFPLEGFVQVGFYDNEGKLLQIETVRMTAIEETIALPLVAGATQLQLDPNMLLLRLDRKQGYFSFD